MTIKNALFFGASLLFLMAAATISCVNYRYGVLLWPTQETTDGINDIYRIRSIDNLNDTATFLSENGKRITLERWRLSIFDNKVDATSFQDIYDTWKHLYARCELRALPIRAEQNRFADIIYRLQEGEVIKIIDRAPTQSNEAGFQDYWYEVLTKSGERGWVFGYYLTLVDETVNADFESGQGASQLTFFLNNVWRPVSFRYMNDTGYIDTGVFKREYGLFTFPLERLITINTQDRLVHFNYNASELLPSGGLLFIGDTAQLGVQFVNSEQVEVSLADGNGDTIVDSFVLFDGDIEQIRNQAVAELSSQIFDILEVGGRFRSSNNEQLIIKTDSTFTTSIKQSNIPNNGSIVFSLYLSSSLSQRYDGVLDFVNAAATAPVHYAYTLSQRAITLFPINGVSGVVVNAQNIAGENGLLLTAY